MADEAPADLVLTGRAIYTVNLPPTSSLATPPTTRSLNSRRTPPIQCRSHAEQAGLREADVGDALFGLQPLGVVVFGVDAAGAELGHFAADAADLPRCLGLVARSSDGAFGHVEVGAAAAPEHDGVLVFPYDRQPGLAVVELSGCGAVGGQQLGHGR